MTRELNGEGDDGIGAWDGPRWAALEAVRVAMSQAVPGYRSRVGQDRMMAAVARAIEGEEVLLVEAGTGIGKSLGYLIPALLSGETVIVSTGTKALQAQLFEVDVPLLETLLDRPFRAAILKGRTNYLCLHKMDEALERPDLPREDRRILAAIAGWSRWTDVGDRAELTELPDNLAIWAQVSTGAEGCLGRRCPQYEDCFVFRARTRAAEADLVIVNHHLFFADLMLRDRAGVRLLPDARVAIFDEAHHIEDVATMQFGESVSDARLRTLARDIQARLAVVDESLPGAGVWGPGGRGAVAQLVATLRQRTADLFRTFAPLGPRTRISPALLPPGVADRLVTLDSAIAALEERCADAADLDEGLSRMADRCIEIRDALERLLLDEHPDHLTWVDQGQRAIFLRSAPIAVGEGLQTTLLARYPTVILTSATLSAGKDLSHIRTRLGLNERSEGSDAADSTDDGTDGTDAASDAPAGPIIRELMIPSPFDYPTQALLYTPTDLPAPNAPDFADAVAERVIELVTISQGRAFVLFTARSNLRRVHALLEGRIPFPLLVQGVETKEALIARFKATPNAVLLGTATFWEGVDVPGDALSLVIIDKLPFAPPGDPLVSARAEAIEAAGGAAFRDYHLPNAILALKQGFGRLIRSESDRGAVVVLDRRITKSSYGRAFIKTLPKAHHLTTLEAFEAHWSNLFSTTDATFWPEPPIGE